MKKGWKPVFRLHPFLRPSCAAVYAVTGAAAGLVALIPQAG